MENSLIFQTNLKFKIEILQKFVLKMVKISGEFLFIFKGSQ